jgi:alpha-galactosidase
MKRVLGLSAALGGLAFIASLTSAADPPTPVRNQNLPKPDGKPADMTKPVQVFILLGQSNMVGLGKVKSGDISLEHAVKEKKKYQYLVDDAGTWSERKDVRFVRYMSGKGPLNNEWLAVKGNTLGPEFGIGHPLGNAIDAPVMLLKCCIGNRALGWDLLPPGSERREFVTKDKAGAEKKLVYAGYKDKPEFCIHLASLFNGSQPARAMSSIEGILARRWRSAAEWRSRLTAIFASARPMRGSA